MKALETAGAALYAAGHRGLASAFVVVAVVSAPSTRSGTKP
jgi:hypothetical protein